MNRILKNRIVSRLLISLVFLLINFNAQSQMKNSYNTSLVSNDIGFVKMYLTIEINDSTFSAYSRQDATKDIFGNGTAMLMKTFAGIKNGSIIRIEGKVKDSSNIKILDGIFISPM